MDTATPTDEPHEADPAKDTRAELQRKFMLKMMFKTLRVRQRQHAEAEASTASKIAVAEADTTRGTDDSDEGDVVSSESKGGPGTATLPSSPQVPAPAVDEFGPLRCRLALTGGAGDGGASSGGGGGGRLSKETKAFAVESVRRAGVCAIEGVFAEHETDALLGAVDHRFGEILPAIAGEATAVGGDYGSGGRGGGGGGGGGGGSGDVGWGDERLLDSETLFTKEVVRRNPGR